MSRYMNDEFALNCLHFALHNNMKADFFGDDLFDLFFVAFM